MKKLLELLLSLLKCKKKNRVDCGSCTLNCVDVCKKLDCGSCTMSCVEKCEKKKTAPKKNTKKAKADTVKKK
jgi:hypothetical protein